MLLSKCAVCNSKNSKFIKEQEARGLISKLVGIKIFLFQKHKMNPIVNKLLLAGEIFMPEIHLRQLRFTFSVCGPFTKNKERIKILKKQEIQYLFMKMNQMKFSFKMIQLMEF